MTNCLSFNPKLLNIANTDSEHHWNNILLLLDSHLLYLAATDVDAPIDPCPIKIWFF